MSGLVEWILYDSNSNIIIWTNILCYSDFMRKFQS